MVTSCAVSYSPIPIHSAYSLAFNIFTEHQQKNKQMQQQQQQQQQGHPGHIGLQQQLGPPQV